VRFRRRDAIGTHSPWGAYRSADNSNNNKINSNSPVDTLKKIRHFGIKSLQFCGRSTVSKYDFSDKNFYFPGAVNFFFRLIKYFGAL